MAARGQARPSNPRIYQVLAEVIGTLVRTRAGRDLKKERFLGNGGILSYEAQPTGVDHGLVEAGTPECRGPSEVVLYQRAQDQLLARALPETARRLGGGELTLLKNCRDAEGHTYGAQENYDAEIGRGGWLLAWRAGLVALIPLVAAASLLTWAVMLAIVPLVLGFMLVVGLLSLIPPLRFLRVALDPEGPTVRVVQRPLTWIERAIWEPLLVVFLLLYRACAFRAARRGLLPLLISRPIISGAGTLVDDRFALSEKGVAVRRVSRWSLHREGVSIFEPGNLCKDLRGPALLDVAAFKRLFRRRQRLQIGFSDSNMAQSAEYLKVAITCLVLDLIEEGALVDPPRVRQPLRVLQQIVDGEHATALALQRRYLEIARAYTRAAPATPLEATEVVSRWSATLDAIEKDPRSLIGQLDWITKRELIEKAGSTPDERKKIDLKYHELETGYFAKLEGKQLAPILVTAEEARVAAEEPPSTTPARARARLIRNLANVAKVTVGWDRVRVGGRIRGKVIRLDGSSPDDDSP